MLGREVLEVVAGAGVVGGGVDSSGALFDLSSHFFFSVVKTLNMLWEKVSSLSSVVAASLTCRI